MGFRMANGTLSLRKDIVQFADGGSFEAAV
jgi:hypothetical protein